MLTNETLLAIVHGKVILGMNDVRPMAEELLTFRSIRDAGDEGVTLLAVGLSNDMSCGGIGVMNSILKLRDIAIARGQQLREAREETTEDMEAIACLSGDVERLTAERDVAREEIEMYEAMKEGFTARATDLEIRIRSLTEELTALRSAPGMEEVDTVVRQMCVDIEDVQGTQNYLDAKNSLIELETVLRRAIVSWDEVVGLLKWLCINTNIRLALDWCGSSPKIKRILEIVEEK